MQNKVALTQSKAGRRFMGFMKVFNSGDMNAIADFLSQYITDDALEQSPLEMWHASMKGIYAATAGMRVMQMVGADEYQVVLLMQAHNNGAMFVVTMAVSEDYPHKISEFLHRPA